MRGVEPDYRLFLQWLILAGLLLFGAVLAWQRGAVQLVVASDPTHLSLLILLLFAAATLHCGGRAWYLSVQHSALRRIEDGLLAGLALTRRADGVLYLADAPLPASLPTAYLAGVLGKYRDGSRQPLEHAQLTELLAERARGQHELGWFITGLLTKLGLLGTVVGFILMLGSVGRVESFDISDVQQLLAHMSVGMSVALYTTLVGLTGSMLLGAQYLLLDRGADALVANAVHCAEIQLWPVPEKAANGDAPPAPVV